MSQQRPRRSRRQPEKQKRTEHEPVKVPIPTVSRTGEGTEKRKEKEKEKEERQPERPKINPEELLRFDLMCETKRFEENRRRLDEFRRQYEKLKAEYEQVNRRILPEFYEPNFPMNIIGEDLGLQAGFGLSPEEVARIPAFRFEGAEDEMQRAHKLSQLFRRTAAGRPRAHAAGLPAQVPRGVPRAGPGGQQTVPRLPAGGAALRMMKQRDWDTLIMPIYDETWSQADYVPRNSQWVRDLPKNHLLKLKTLNFKFPEYKANQQVPCYLYDRMAQHCGNQYGLGLLEVKECVDVLHFFNSCLQLNQFIGQRKKFFPEEYVSQPLSREMPFSKHIL